MQLSHLEGDERGLGLDEVLAKIERRVGPHHANNFWLSHDEADYPCLNVVVNGEPASVHYFADERSMFSANVLPVDGRDPRGDTELLGLGDYYSFMNTTFLSPSTLRRVLEEFTRSVELPRTIEWARLT